MRTAHRRHIDPTTGATVHFVADGDVEATPVVDRRIDPFARPGASRQRLRVVLRPRDGEDAGRVRVAAAVLRLAVFTVGVGDVDHALERWKRPAPAAKARIGKRHLAALEALDRDLRRVER